MIENLKRVREPAAWVVLAVAVVGLVLAGVRFALALTMSDTTFSAAAQDLALQAMNLTTVAVIVALVGACVFVNPPTPRAGLLATTAAWVVTLGAVVTLVATVLGLRASASAFAVVLEFLGGLLDIVLKAVAASVLWLIHRGLRAGRLQGPVLPPAPAVHAAPVSAATEPEPEVEREGGQPAWRPNEAAGSVWTTAEEAASGAPASGWVGQGAPPSGGAVAASGIPAVEGPGGPGGPGWDPRGQGGPVEGGPDPAGSGSIWRPVPRDPAPEPDARRPD